MNPVIPKTACTAKTTRNDSSRLDVVAVKPSAPARIRNAPSEATMFIAWSAKKDFQEKTLREGGWLSGLRVAAAGSCRGASDGVAGIACAGTCGASDSSTTGTAGEIAESWRKVCRRD